MPAPTSVMYGTIHRTPDDLRRLAAGGWEPAAAAARVVGDASRVFCVGIGTSYHAAANAAFHLRWAGVDAEAVSSFDFTVYETPLRPADAVIVFGHRGFKRFSAASLERAKAAGAPVIAVTGIESQVEDATVILTTTPQEKSAAFTASHSGAMYVSAQVACLVAEARRMDVSQLRADLDRLPAVVEEVFSREDDIAAVASRSLRQRIYAAGSGPDGLLATEVALKSREAAYNTIDGMPTEQFIHGPLVTVSRGDFAILFATHEAGRPRTLALLKILDRIGVESWIVGGLPAPPPTATTFALPDIHAVAAPILGVIPLQLYSCYQAQAAGTPGDTFRRDVPEYSEAFGKVKL